jgi:hypothetical protein
MVGFFRFSRLAAGLAWACFGLFVSQASSAAAMSFDLVQLGQSNFCGRGCAQIIAAEGEITESTPDEFLAFAKANAKAGQTRNVLFLDSPGGNVVGSLKLGKMLRRLGTAVVVARVLHGPDDRATAIAAGRCMSACVYALMGGRKRVVPPESEVGIHRMFRREVEHDAVSRLSETRTFFAPEEMVDALSRYSGAMGISPKLVAMAEQIPPETVHIVTPSEMIRWRLGTPRF